MRATTYLGACVVLSGLGLSGCSTAGVATQQELPVDAVVTYAFHDSSVPPPYHRSVTLTVTREESHLVIDSYGDVLADETVTTPADVWQQLGETLPTLTDLTVESVDGGCVGGTSTDLRIVAGADSVVDLTPEFCAGANEGLEESLDAWIRPARELFPATDVLAPEGE